MISGFVSINTVLAKLYRDLGINSELNEGDVYEWVAEALALIGAYGQYNEISHCLTLKDGKAKLPCGFYKLVDISYKNGPVYWATNTNANNYQCDNCNIPTCQNGKCEYTFYLNDSYLISNINNKKVEGDEEQICIVYLGIPVDENDLPMIPDDVYYMKAVAAYVTSMLDYQDWRKGKIADKVKAQSEADWLFYVKAAKGAANMPNVQQIENLKNVMRRLMPITNDYKRGFKNFNKGEQINLK